MEKIVLKAPAKINLYLNVIGKRADGYHDIESLMQAVDLCDNILLERSDTIELSCSDPLMPPGEGNLAHKAAKLLQSRFYFPGVRIELSKNIPSGSGLGGGSSDAAFVLRGLIALYGLKPSRAELAEIAADIGSDVPFFLTGGQALISGRGEIAASVDLSLDYEVVIVIPNLSISTAEIYGNLILDLTKRTRYSLLSKRIDLSRLMRISEEFRNDLENVTTSLYPDLAKIRGLLEGTGAFFVAMTGSGSSFFGLFARGARPRNLPDDLVEHGYRVFQCRPILLPPLSL